MTEDDLLNACRLFWKFNPGSAAWHGMDYAVVAHDRRTRAVVKIDDFIGRGLADEDHQEPGHARDSRDVNRIPPRIMIPASHTLQPPDEPRPAAQRPGAGAAGHQD
jgi:hypothetical protein